jgi:hypothetical protein
MKLFIIFALFISQSAFAISAANVRKCAAGTQTLPMMGVLDPSQMDAKELEAAYETVLDKYSATFNLIRRVQLKGIKEDGHTTGVSGDDVLDISVAFIRGCTDVGPVKRSAARKLATGLQLVAAMLADVKHAPVPSPK